jgi:hypothetical protein
MPAHYRYTPGCCCGPPAPTTHNVKVYTDPAALSDWQVLRTKGAPPTGIALSLIAPCFDGCVVAQGSTTVANPLVRVAPADGATLWQVEHTFVSRLAGDTLGNLYVGHPAGTAKLVSRLSSADGASLWTRTGFTTNACLFLAIDETGAGVYVVESGTPNFLRRLSPTDGSVLWSLDINLYALWFPLWFPLVATSATVYTTGGFSIAAVDAVTGTILWRRDVPWDPGDIGPGRATTHCLGLRIVDGELHMVGRIGPYHDYPENETKLWWLRWALDGTLIGKQQIATPYDPAFLSFSFDWPGSRLVGLLYYGTTGYWHVWDWGTSAPAVTRSVSPAPVGNLTLCVNDTSVFMASSPHIYAGWP